jgi:antitoxin (DNA-binding transcriptional repressor) of toxin-antitoxin stability system
MYFHLYEVTGHFAETIQAVKAGKEVVLTDHHVPIAVIQPLRPASKEEDAEIRKLIDSGLLRPVGKPGEVREWKWKHLRTRAA